MSPTPVMKNEKRQFALAFTIIVGLVVIVMLCSRIEVTFPITASVKAAIPFVMRLPIPMAMDIRIEDNFEKADRDIPKDSHLPQKPSIEWITIPSALRTQLIDLYTTWCRNPPPEWTDERKHGFYFYRQDHFYELAMLCPGDTKPTVCLIPPDQLPATLSELITLMSPVDP
jgi:hypothetical protein